MTNLSRFAAADLLEAERRIVAEDNERVIVKLHQIAGERQRARDEEERRAGEQAEQERVDRERAEHAERRAAREAADRAADLEAWDLARALAQHWVRWRVDRANSGLHETITMLAHANAAAQELGRPDAEVLDMITLAVGVAYGVRA